MQCHETDEHNIDNSINNESDEDMDLSGYDTPPWYDETSPPTSPVQPSPTPVIILPEDPPAISPPVPDRPRDLAILYARDFWECKFYHVWT